MALLDDHSRLFRHSLLLLAATQVGNLSALLYQVFLMRSLPPVEFGVAAAMFGAIVIGVIPLDALRTAVAHYAARYCQAGSPGRVRGLVAGWGAVMAVAALGVLGAAAVGRSGLAAFFQLESSEVIVVAAAVLAGSLFMPLFAGALQGTQAFGWLAISGQSWGVFRLLAGMALVWGVQATAGMALLGQGAGVLGCLALGALGLSLVLRGKPQPPTASLVGGASYFAKSLLVLAGYAVLANADICMVKHYFSPEDSGAFARAATIGRGIVFLAMPVAMVLFPKVVSAGAVSAADRRLLLRALGFAAGLVAAASVAAVVLAGWIWHAFVGRTPTAEELGLLRSVLGAMCPLGLVYMMLNFELAQRRFRWAWAAVVCALAYVGGVALWHQSLGQVVAVMAGVNSVALLTLALGMPWKPLRA